VNRHQVQYGLMTLASPFAAIFAVVVASGMSTHAGAQLQSTNPPQQAASKTAADPSALYCNLKALSPPERGRLHELVQKLKGARIETEELPDGYAFRLQTEQVSLGELAAYVMSERKCCPFFDFEIELERDGGPLWLRLRGKDGVKAFMRHEFDIQ
jgi:hypothetical protein